MQEKAGPELLRRDRPLFLAQQGAKSTIASAKSAPGSQPFAHDCGHHGAPTSGIVDVRIQTSDGANLVRLAPSGFLKQSGARLQEGDSMTIEAFPAMKGNLMVATKVRGSGVEMRLRDSSGHPLWSIFVREHGWSAPQRF